MHIVVDVQPDTARYAAAFRHVQRGAFNRVRIMGAICLVLGIVIIGLIPEDLPLGLAVAACGALFAFYVPWMSIRKGLTGLPLALRQPQRIELTDAGVQVLSPLISTQYAWAAFEKTEEIPGALLLMLGRRQVLPVPTDTVPPQQREQLRQFLADRAFARL